MNTLPAPNGLSYLPYQEDGIGFLMERKAALLADEQGLGKTVQAIGAVNGLGARRVLVVCPASVKLNWRNELRTWLCKKRVIQVVDRANAIVSDLADIVIVNYDLLTYGLKYSDEKRPRILGGGIYDQIVAQPWAVGIFDEAHYMKNPDAVRTKIVLSRGRIASRCMYKWYLTGTPVSNRPYEIYSIVKANAPEVIEPFDDRVEFGKRFCAGWFDPTRQEWDFSGASNLEELNRRLYKDFMLRRIKTEVLPDLPPKRYQIVPIEATDTMKKLIEREEGVDYEQLTEMDFDRVDLSLGGIPIAMHRREVAEAKVNQCLEYICGMMDTVEKLVVFAHHRSVVAALQQGLEQYNPVVLVGGTNTKNRQNAVDTFQTVPSCRIFIGNTQAAGEGITLTAASNVVFVEPSWVPREISQAVDRLHRIGQKDAVNAVMLVINDSIEEFMMHKVVKKAKIIDKIMVPEAAAGTIFD